MDKRKQEAQDSRYLTRCTACVGTAAVLTEAEATIRAMTSGVPRADEPTLRRLAFVRYIYTLGLEQSTKSEPLSSASILQFHDAVELFLQLASETLDVPASSSTGFLEYWDLLAPKVEGGIAQKAAMRRLNRARVNLKHHGTRPTVEDIHAFRNSTTQFFLENTPRVFGVQLSDVSLADLVLNTDVRDDLRAAETALGRDDVRESLKCSAVAFQRLADDFDTAMRDQYGRTPFQFGKELTSFTSHHMHLRGGAQYGGSPESREIAALKATLGRFVDAVKNTVESIQDALKLLSLGLDYQRYIRFLALTPHVYRTMDSPEYKVHEPAEEQPAERQDAEFCIEFVIESALRLQDFAPHTGLRPG